VAGLKDVNSVAHVDDDSRFIFGEENLFGVPNDDYLPVHAKLKWAKRSRM
jgi:hypothetical protein